MALQLLNSKYSLFPEPKQSGMGEVYKARDLESDRLVAIKVFSNGKIEEEISKESYRREIQALQELKHPQIVQMIDSGVDEKTGHNFLVLEWMEQNLLKLLQESPIEGWDSFWEGIGEPLLEALAFCHNREYIHRDIKPENILINAEGTIKLADFGISKLKRFLLPTVTLREFGSRPYTPPEEDDGSFTYTRDVFSFGVVTLKCLTNETITNYQDIEQVIDRLDAPKKILGILGRSVSLSLEERYNNAEVLLSEIKAFQEQRKLKHSKFKQKCYLKLIPSSIEKIGDELKADSEKDIENIIAQDLNTDCGIYRYKSRNSEEYEDGQYQIFGVDYSYHVGIDRYDRDKLVIFNARHLSSDILEKNRLEGWQPSYEFEFSGRPNRVKAKEIIKELKLRVEQHAADLRQKQAQEEKQRLFRIWDSILRAKTDWEKKRKPPLRYTKVIVHENRAIFTLDSIPDEDILGEPRYVPSKQGKSLLAGDIEDIQDDQLTLYINYRQVDNLPKTGVLLFDTRASQSALNQQKYALDTIKYNRAVRSDLRTLLIDPKEVFPSNFEKDLQFIQSLNESQQDTVRAALGTQDFLIVEGPPGTGKTTFITELILQTLQNNSEARILLTSQTHVALDNALERIQKQNKDLQIVRIGNHERVAESVHTLLLEEQMENWKDNVREKSKNFIIDWAKRHQLDPKDIKMSMLFQTLRNSVAKLEELKKESESRKQEKFELLSQNKINLDNYEFNSPSAKIPENSPDELKNQLSYLDKRIKECEQKAKSIRKEQHNSAATELNNLSHDLNKEEILKMPLEDLEVYETFLSDPNNDKAKTMKKLMKIQQEWFDIFGRSDRDRFNAALLKRSQIVAGTCIGLARSIPDVEFDLCIIDEASKATATEVLVPIARSRRWILVGDTKQLPPFQDEASRNRDFLDKYDLTSEEVKETLFAYLLRSLPETNKKILSIQHRMVAPIGDLISDCFYDSQIQSARTDLDINLNQVIPKPVTWLSTSKLTNCREEKVKQSFQNIAEAQIIVDLIAQLDRMAQSHNTIYSVAVLTGYLAQLKLIKRKLDRESSNWEALNIQCNTVDAFQGQEADIAIYSVTRSNKKRNPGFLRDIERMNVALSRGKVGLAIVGDHNFCRSLKYNPLRTVLEYIESHPESCCLQEAKQ